MFALPPKADIAGFMTTRPSADPVAPAELSQL